MRDGPGLTSERPARRDARSGHYLLHPAYEGWKPREREPTSWRLGIAVLAFVAGALWVLTRT